MTFCCIHFAYQYLKTWSNPSMAVYVSDPRVWCESNKDPCLFFLNSARCSWYLRTCHRSPSALPHATSPRSAGPRGLTRSPCGVAPGGTGHCCPCGPPGGGGGSGRTGRLLLGGFLRRPSPAPPAGRTSLPGARTRRPHRASRRTQNYRRTCIKKTENTTWYCF